VLAVLLLMHATTNFQLIVVFAVLGAGRVRGIESLLLAGDVASDAGLEQLPGCCGIKIFMGSSTGNLLVRDKRLLRDVLKRGRRRIARPERRSYVACPESKTAPHD